MTVIGGFTSCTDDDDSPVFIDVTVADGVFVLNEGSYFSGINGTLDYLDYKTATMSNNILADIYNLGGTPNNAIIVGRSSYTGLLMAYEGQCPNCLTDFGGISYPLTWTKNGLQVECARCHRSYDINNGVVAAGDGGRQLYTYNIALDGAVLRAWN